MAKKTSSSKRSVAGASKTQKFAGLTFTKKLCTKYKKDAVASADSSRSAGKKARVVKGDGVWCVFTRGGVRGTRLKHGLAGRRKSKRSR